LSGDPLDGRSDVYSLALVLFKMLTGTLPFEGTTVQDTMVKRLTDDPAKLADARPDLRFPPGLQATLDSALARRPIDRYQSAAKFADDLAAVLGAPRRSRASPLPPTRPEPDAPTERLRRPTPIVFPSTPAKRRSRMPIVAGVLVVLGAAGAALALRGGKKVDTAARVDTVPRVDAGRAPDTAAGRPSVTALPTKPAPRPSPPPRRERPRSMVDIASARAMLKELVDTLEPRTARMVFDSATDIFNAPGLARNDKAYAAFVVGIALFQLNDRTRGCEWVRRATELDPLQDSYRTILEQCQR